MKWYQVKKEQDLNTPTLLIYPDRVQSNINRAIEIVGDVARLRPHVKTNKMLEVGKLLVQSGIEKCKCATIAEAEMMARAGCKDILIAYQLLGPRITQLLQLKRSYPQSTFSSLVDCSIGVDQIDNIATSSDTFSVFIDVDVDHHRTGIPVGSQFKELIKTINQAAHINLIGFHAYDGHATAIDLTERTTISDMGFAPLLPYIKDHPNLTIVAGGSPSFMVHAQHADRECSPGTFVFWDHGYQSKYPEYKFDYAAVLATRVISQINTTTYCFDLGHKHVASEGVSPQIALLNTPGYKQLTHSEEHLVIQFDTPFDLKVGDVLYGIPRHICPTVALYPYVQTVVNHSLEQNWMVLARNLQLS